MARFLHVLLAAARLVAGQASSTCPNEVAIYNPQDRTMAMSNSQFRRVAVSETPVEHTYTHCSLVLGPRAQSRCQESAAAIISESV